VKPATAVLKHDHGIFSVLVTVISTEITMIM